MNTSHSNQYHNKIQQKKKEINNQHTRITDDNISRRKSSKHMLVVDYQMSLLLLLFNYVPIGKVVNHWSVRWFIRTAIDDISNICLFFNAFVSKETEMGKQKRISLKYYI